MNKAPNKTIFRVLAKDKETVSKKVKASRTPTAQPATQALGSGPKLKIDTPGTSSAKPVAGLGLNKKRGSNVLLPKVVTEPVDHLINHELAHQKVKDQAAAEIMSYLERFDLNKSPKLRSNATTSNEEFHTSSFPKTSAFIINRPATGSTARRDSVIKVKGTRKSIGSTKLRAQLPLNTSASGSKSEILKHGTVTPPNSGASADAEPKDPKTLRSAPSYDSLMARVRVKIAETDRGGGSTRRPKSSARDTETTTVMPVRALTKTSSLQVMVPQHLKELKARLDMHKNPTKTRMTLNKIIGKPTGTAAAPPAEAKKPLENKTTKAIRSAILELAIQDADRNKVRKSLSAENWSSVEISKDTSKLKKAGTKGKLKKSGKSKPKTASQSPSKEQFLEFQNKKVDEQFLHVYERQERLESEIRRLIDALEIEQAIRGSASHGLSSSPCCCSAEIRGKLKSLLQKQKQLIRLQIDLRKRYGVGPGNWENQTDPDMPILNGYNMPFERFASFAREQNGKMIYYCENCKVSSDTELLFRLHLESPQHVVKAYKDIHNSLPIYQCEGCELDLKGTTKYMNHVTSDDVHALKHTGVTKSKSSNQALTQTLFGNNLN